MNPENSPEIRADIILADEQKIALIQRWQAVKAQIHTLNPATTLLAVSKTHPADSIATLYQQGQQHFGENYVQEALSKMAALKNLPQTNHTPEIPLSWHYIGHIQRNKTRELSENFAWVHGVDRLIIAERLSSQRPSDLPPLNICIQVNIDDETSKSGCTPEEVPELVRAIGQLPQLTLRGLMVIPAPIAEKVNESAFSRTKALFETCRSYHARPEDWDTLSMGMSDDMAVAIATGSTMVRVGTAIFGARNYTKVDKK